MRTICLAYKRKYILRRLALSAAIMRRIRTQLRLVRRLTSRGQQCAAVQTQEVWVVCLRPLLKWLPHSCFFRSALDVTPCTMNTV